MSKKKHAIIEYEDESIKQIVDQHEEWRERVFLAALYGYYKFDYGNGLVKIAVEGKLVWGENKKYLPEKFQKAKAGYRLLGKRIGNENDDVQRIRIFWGGDETTKKEDYTQIITDYSVPVEVHGYFGGKPCNPSGDRNNDEDRNRINSTQLWAH